jgi:hypothetical protein
LPLIDPLSPPCSGTLPLASCHVCPKKTLMHSLSQPALIAA